jgi:ATP-binding cassette, subfamily B, bacterial PglK
VYRKLKLLIGTFSKADKRKFYQLQILVFLMTIVQIVSIASFAPFILLISDKSTLESSNFLAIAYEYSGLTKDRFIFYAGLLLIFLIVMSSLLSIVINWMLYKFSNNLGMNLSTRLLNYYLRQNYLFHVTHSSSFLMKQIIIEVRRVGDGIVTPLIQMSSNILFIFFVSVSLTFYNPIIIVSGGSILFGFYLLIYIVTKSKIQINGQNLTDKSLLRSNITLNSLGGIRDIIHMNKQSFFVSKFENASNSFARSQALNTVFGLIPKFIVEFVVLCVIVLSLIFFIEPGTDAFEKLVPVIVVFGLLFIKLIPAFQAVFGNLAKIKSNLPAFDSLRKDFLKMQEPVNVENMNKAFTFNKLIEMKNLHYKYPGNRTRVLNGLDLTIRKNTTTGLVGYSGSGKSTLADILVGLLELDEGQILVDGKVLDSTNYHLFNKKIGFVSQSIFLLDASIRENIAFGEENDAIDDVKMNNAIKQANLDNLLDDMPEGILTEVGERGIQLSGGQVQRIAIARALYTECEVLIFDEATSALDGITEKYILDSVTKLQGTKTILMIAHRLTTLSGCDSIYVIDKGVVNDVGDFKSLSRNSSIFKQMLNNEND